MRTAEYSRLWAAVDATGDCWEWIGKMNNKGYGLFFLNPKRASVRRGEYARRTRSACLSRLRP